MSLTPGDPDPVKWKLIREQRSGRGLVLEIDYPGCTNYEGRKVLVFQAYSLDEITKKNKGWLDPHFLNDPKLISPVARFEPTDRGWRMALACAKAL
ncbi:hypothetical protein HOU02_gp468 [Caulobacter phage CcrBL9]|uniref:Uncharacterized protein n=1 Tax=Caulobacter phage CcrBL9 TaxID=2283270 RepID=A0A385EEM0_9CAUD|nr:hypothetical protein HOU02_gp468 [Caulobacter phage CcrBL9]AXQ69257.1 hypothetical protein CcrBL9_gp233c [Caulobacter phage CcrBL9]